MSVYPAIAIVKLVSGRMSISMPDAADLMTDVFESIESYVADENGSFNEALSFFRDLGTRGDPKYRNLNGTDNL